MKRDLGKLKDLSAPDLQKIAAAIDQSGIRQAAAAASAQHERPIDNTCIQRFNERSVARHFLSGGPDTAAAAAEILRFAATGAPDFTEATLKVLEQTAFKLALAAASPSDSASSAPPANRQDERSALAQITTMLCRFRTTFVRERMARVQEEKLRLREKELELKKAKVQSPPPPAPQEDELGPYAHDFEGLRRRAIAMFGDHRSNPRTSNPTAPIPSPPEQTATETLLPPSYLRPQAAAVQNSSPTGQQPAPADPPVPHSSCTTTSLESIDAFSPSSQLPPEPAPTPAAEPAPYRQSKNISLPYPEPPQPTEAVELSDPEPLLTPAEERAKEYAIRRARFALHRDGEGLSPDSSWRDLCPCGATLPCPEHGNLFLGLRYHPITHPDYIDALREAGIPVFSIVKGPPPAFHLHATHVS